MKRVFARWVMKLAGWKLTGDWPASDKCIMVVAPHTSFFDWFWGVMGYWSNGKNANFLIKGRYFFFPLGLILRATGGIPVYSGKSRSFVEEVTKHVAKTDKLYLTITPEGTRARVKRWRIGFYRMAVELDLPLLLGKMDYKKKEMKLMTLYYPSGNINQDLQEIFSYYIGAVPKHPERTYLPLKTAESC